MQRNEIEQAAIDHFGREKQLLKVVEECNELATTILHYLNGRGNDMDVITEVADVAIMIDQLALMFDAELIKTEMARKLIRLERRLNNEA